MLPRLDAIEHALIRHVMRKNPQPHALSFGFQHKTLLRTFEFGSGVGLSKTLHSSDNVRLLNDERCSRLLASTLTTRSRSPIRRTDLEAIAAVFNNLVDLAENLEIKIHLIVKKSLTKKAFSPDGITLLHNIPVHSAALATTTEIVPRAQRIEPDYDWLRLAQTVDCDLAGSPWASVDSEMFWLHCFPAIQLSHHTNGLRASSTASPRELLYRCKDRDYLSLFAACNFQVDESRQQAPPAAQRKRARVAPGMGNAYRQKLPERYTSFKFVKYEPDLTDLTPWLNFRT